MRIVEQIAVDIVLLPVREVMDKAIEANRELLKQHPDKIVLNRENCLPHVSLAMGCIDKADIPGIEKILIEIAEKYSPKSLNLTGFHTEKNSIGENVTVACIKKTKKLQSLHEEIMTKLKRFFSYNVLSNMLLSEEKVSESTLLWIKNYSEKSGFKNFLPHITLGYGQLENHSFPRKIPVSRLALCHLGNHCTCKKILVSVSIK